MKINRKSEIILALAAMGAVLSFFPFAVNAAETENDTSVTDTVTVKMVSDISVKENIDELSQKKDILSERTNMLYTHSFGEDEIYSEKDMSRYNRLLDEHYRKLKNSYAVAVSNEKNKEKAKSKKLSKKTEKNLKNLSEDEGSETSDDLIEKNEEKTVIVNYGSYGVCGAYMGYHLITAVSDQLNWKLSHSWYYDSEGFARYDDRYIIACTNTFGDIGDHVDFYLENGEMIKGIIGDLKWDGDSTYCVFGHVLNNCLNVIEFVVSPSWYSGHENPGTEPCHPEWGVKVSYAVCEGNCDIAASGSEPVTSEHNEENEIEERTSECIEE